MPSCTLPNIVCFLSKCGGGACFPICNRGESIYIKTRVSHVISPSPFFVGPSPFFVGHVFLLSRNV
jgi:hypothetical protein